MCASISFDKRQVLGVNAAGTTLTRWWHRTSDEQGSGQLGAELRYTVHDAKGTLKAALYWCSGDVRTDDETVRICDTGVPAKTWVLTKGTAADVANVTFSDGPRRKALEDRLVAGLKLEPLRLDKRLRRACFATGRDKRDRWTGPCEFYLGSGKHKQKLHAVHGRETPAYDGREHSYRGRLLWHPWLGSKLILEVHHKARGGFPDCTIDDVETLELPPPTGYAPPAATPPKKTPRKTR